MTATPRHYNVSKKNKEGEHQLVYSMDVPETYGNLVHQLSFAKAIEQDIICDYKVAISVVTSNEVNNHILSQGEVLVEGDLVRAKQVANQIALQRAVEKYQTGKIITFHGVVKSAKSFVSQGNEGVGYHLPDFDCWHVNGTMPTSNREQTMKEFRSANNSIISNARCLTEGVDVPAVDMVCFMSPKKSKVDIVQATGRAMRKSEGKDYGYILIPLFLELKVGESIEEALERTDFGEVWNVLQALKEQDEVLVDIIAQMRVDKGRTKGFDDSRFREKIEILGAEIDLETLRKVITTRLIESLGLSWDEMYGQLIAYREEFGHCNVPQGYPDNLRLSSWVNKQRQQKKNGMLSTDKVERLDSLGFSWDLHEDAWNLMYQALQEYKQEHGDCNVPYGYPDNPQLGTWVKEQRKAKKNGKLSTDKVERLDSLGFSWDLHEDTWNEMYQALQEYKQEHGHCNVPQGYPDNSQLATWVKEQRKAKKNGKLSTDRVERLDSLGFSWDLHEDTWNEMYQALQEYKQEHGDCNVPSSYLDNPKLGRWVDRQRSAKKNEKLSSDKIQKLDSLGFSRDPDEGAWNEMYQALQEYKQKHGHCNVPTKYPDNPQLGIWVGHQRTSKKNGKLSSDRIQKLEVIGFSWDPDEDAWNRMYQTLQEYKQEHGHCNVPRGYPDNPKPATWISGKRQQKKNGKLSSDKIQKLEEVGFSWDAIEDAWNRMYQALQEYKKEHGHCNVPNSYPDNPQLGNWVDTQGTSKRKGTLSKDKTQKLEAIGFQWTSRKPNSP